MNFELYRGVIIDADFNPTLGSETGKIRPCIIVTNDIYNKKLPIIQVVPITTWTEKKSVIITNVTIPPTEQNGLTHLSIADCLQTRPIDYTERFKSIRGVVEPEIIRKINLALKLVFNL
ncbi:MAG: growth inhibitor [Ignavibacteria bacterium]|nr:growth inhibitor [Ignavibacteria bacterium]